MGQSEETVNGAATPLKELFYSKSEKLGLQAFYQLANQSCKIDILVNGYWYSCVSALVLTPEKKWMEVFSLPMELSKTHEFHLRSKGISETKKEDFYNVMKQDRDQVYEILKVILF